MFTLDVETQVGVALVNVHALVTLPSFINFEIFVCVHAYRLPQLNTWSSRVNCFYTCNVYDLMFPYLVFKIRAMAIPSPRIRIG